MNNQNIRHALSKIAWAYLLILLNFRINDLDLLPNWAGYLLIFLAIGQLSGELRNLPLLKPFCILLGIAAGVDWLALPLSGAELTGRFFLLSALVACVALYFHFQLLTDLALLADGPGEAPVLARRLRVCRNIDAVLQIAVACGCAATLTRCCRLRSPCCPFSPCRRRRHGCSCRPSCCSCSGWGRGW